MAHLELPWGSLAPYDLQREPIWVAEREVELYGMYLAFLDSAATVTYLRLHAATRPVARVWMSMQNARRQCFALRCAYVLYWRREYSSWARRSGRPAWTGFRPDCQSCGVPNGSWCEICRKGLCVYCDRLAQGVCLLCQRVATNQVIYEAQATWQRKQERTGRQPPETIEDYRCEHVWWRIEQCPPR